MSNETRKMTRQAEIKARKEMQELFRRASSEGARLEAHFKSTINKLPWLQRQILGYKVMRGIWK